MMKIIISIFALFLLLDTSIAENFQSAVRSGDTHIHSIQTTSSGSHHQERSLSSLWSFFSFLHGPHPHHDAGGGNGGGNSRSGGGSESSDYNNGGGSGGDVSSATSSGGDGSSSGNGSGGDESSSGNGSGGDESYSGSSSSTAEEGVSSSGKSGIADFFNSTEGKITSITLATLAASVAIAAMYMGSRNRNGNGKKHALKGVLQKRMGLFSRMAGRSNCATCRPESVDSAVLEGNESGADYRLA